MKKSYKQLFFVCLAFAANVYRSEAQIMVDADLKDWGDSSKFNYDDQNVLNYSYRKDNQFLYLAIRKNKNASKFFSGGVQLSFSSSKIDADSFQITFAQSVVDPTSNARIQYNHDYINLSNYDGLKNQLLAKYNETGILVEWKYTDIDYIPKGDVIRSDEIPANPNVFTAELQIPLSYLQKKMGNKINFSICLRGHDKEKKGLQYYLNKRFPAPKNVNETENQEKMYFTEYYGILDLTKI